MLLQSLSSSGTLPFPRLLLHRSKSKEQPLRKTSSTSLSKLVCLSVGPEAIAEIAHNKVIVAAAASALIGQIAKPFTSVLLYGNKFEINCETAFRSGGFPSAHSSAVVAAATSLGLERGFSDAIFGLAVVYAGITMYDAQGVRREVGIHAKELNKILPKTPCNSFPSNDDNDLIDSALVKPSSSSLERLEPHFSDEPISFGPKKTHAALLQRSNDRKSQNTPTLISSSSLSADVKGGSGGFARSYAPLKESIGHTEIEVLAGAILGLFVSLIVHTI